LEVEGEAGKEPKKLTFVGLVSHDPELEIPLPPPPPPTSSPGEPIGIPAADDELNEEDALLDELDQLPPPPSSSKPSSFNGNGRALGGASFPSGEDPQGEEKMLLREVEAGRGRRSIEEEEEGGGGCGWWDDDGEEAGRCSIGGVKGKGGD